MKKVILEVLSSDYGKTIQVTAFVAFIVGFFIGIYIGTKLDWYYGIGCWWVELKILTSILKVKSLRKLIKSKAAWVSKTVLLKQLYISINKNEKSWKKKACG